MPKCIASYKKNPLWFYFEVDLEFSSLTHICINMRRGANVFSNYYNSLSYVKQIQIEF